MGKIFVFGMVVLLFTSCGQGKNQAPIVDSTGTDLEVEKLPKKSRSNAKANKILKDWPEFNALESSFDVVYTVENREDLMIAVEDLIEKQKLLEASEYPQSFNVPQIKGRQKVFKTYVLRLKFSLEYRTGAMSPTVEMVDAYNAIRNQFNVIVNSTLDTILILDE